MNIDVFKLIKRVEKNGIALTSPSDLNRILSKKKPDYVVYENRRTKKAVIINEKRLKELLGEYFL